MIEDRWPVGTPVTSVLDDFSGTVQGYYQTREGKWGLVIQYHNKRFCHLYSERWIVREKPQ